MVINIFQFNYLPDKTSADELIKDANWYEAHFKTFDNDVTAIDRAGDANSAPAKNKFDKNICHSINSYL